MRFLLFSLGLLVVGCTPKINVLGEPRPDIVRDVEAYAIASCLTKQSLPYLKDQGDAWASVIIQRMKGSLDALTGIAEQVARESAKGEMAFIRNEGGADKPLPLLYCGEIIDKPAVRVEIRKAIAQLKSSYEQ